MFIVSTLIDTGLNRVIMVNGHGGNVNPIFYDAGAPDLACAGADGR